MEGLLTVFPVGRVDEATQEGSGLPALSVHDVESLTALAKEFEIDFLCLSFTSHPRDIVAARTFLASVGLVKTQVGRYFIKRTNKFLPSIFFCSQTWLIGLKR